MCCIFQTVFNSWLWQVIKRQDGEMVFVGWVNTITADHWSPALGPRANRSRGALSQPYSIHRPVSMGPCGNDINRRQASELIGRKGDCDCAYECRLMNSCSSLHLWSPCPPRPSWLLVSLGSCRQGRRPIIRISSRGSVQPRLASRAS